MKALLIFLLFLVWSTISHAENTLASGGKSPNGRYEVRIYKSGGPDDSDPSNYSYGVLDTRNGKVLQNLNEGGGFCDYQGAIEMAKVLWNSAGDVFALIDHGTRHSMELYIYNVKSSSISEVKVPDYLKEGLSLVGANQCYGTSVVKLGTWKGDTLACSFIFDAETDAGRSPFYDTTFTITVQHGKKNGAQITSMEKPKTED